MSVEPAALDGGLAALAAIALGVLLWCYRPLSRWRWREWSEPLTTYELAFLAGGVAGAWLAALAGLRQAGLVEVRDGRLVAVAPLPSDADPLERAIGEAAVAGRATRELPDRLVRAAVVPLARRLRRAGLAAAAGSRLRWFVAMLASAAVALTGFMGGLVAGPGDQPVMLAVGVVMMVATLAAIAAGRPQGTPGSRQVLAAQRRRNRDLSPGWVQTQGLRRLTPPQAALAVALYGPAVLFAADLSFAVEARLDRGFRVRWSAGGRAGAAGDGWTPPNTGVYGDGAYYGDHERASSGGAGADGGGGGSDAGGGGGG